MNEKVDKFAEPAVNGAGCTICTFRSEHVTSTET